MENSWIKNSFLNYGLKIGINSGMIIYQKKNNGNKKYFRSSLSNKNRNKLNK
jgi:hypothetical protein